MAISMNVIILLYLVASVFFIQALKGLSHPRTSRRGNAFGMVGMAIAIVTTIALVYKLAPQIATAGMGWVLLGLVIGGAVGTAIAFKVEMTKMPEMVAFMHSMIGLAAVFIAIAAVAEPWAFGIARARRADPGRQPLRTVHRRVRRRDHVLRLGDRVRQAGRQVQVPAVPGRAGRVPRPAHDQPGPCDRDAGVRAGVRVHAELAGVLGDARDRASCSAC